MDLVSKQSDPPLGVCAVFPWQPRSEQPKRAGGRHPVVVQNGSVRQSAAPHQTQSRPQAQQQPLQQAALKMVGSDSPPHRFGSVVSHGSGRRSLIKQRGRPWPKRPGCDAHVSMCCRSTCLFWEHAWKGTPALDCGWGAPGSGPRLRHGGRCALQLTWTY